MNRNCNEEFIGSLITMLSLKMRNFNLEVRVTSLCAFKELGSAAGRFGGEWEKVMRKVVPMMIEKEKLAKEVSYIKGLFLQTL